MSEPQALEPHPDPIEQWLRWEEEANLLGFRTGTEPVELAVAEVSRECLAVDVGANAPREIVERFLRDDRVCYPKHPLNRDPEVAFFHEPVREHWLARYTSSRTLVVVDGIGARFSIKLSTDHPHPNFVQPEKTRLREETEDAMRFARRIDAVDAWLGPEPQLLFVKEVLTVLVRDGEHGFAVRDLQPLHDGHYYLPGLSVPWCGREIAQLHGGDFGGFWGRWYAESVGRAKARLLARYGLQYDTPNPQNLLIQLSPELLPTGAVVMRDIGDHQPVTDLEDAAAGPPRWGRLSAPLKPETENSFWAFDNAGERTVPPEILADWYARHDRAYLSELRSFWQLPLPGETLDASTLERLGSFLRSAQGERQVEAAFERRTGRAAVTCPTSP